MSGTRTYSLDPLPLEYDDLVRMHAPRPIHDDVGLENTVEIIDRLAVLDNPTRDQSDYLAILANTVEEYENARHEIDLSRLAPIDVLKHLLKESGLTAADLGRLLGNVSLGSAILRGERKPSKSHIVALCRHFRVSADLFLR